MIVVADSSPLNYLILIAQVQILPRLFHRVAVPLAVQEELRRTGAPHAVSDWIENPPEWLEVHRLPPGFESHLAHLDPGEQQAIALARRIRAEHILIDDLKGRMAAEETGLSVVGTIGILQRAGRKGLLDFQSAFRALAETNFRMSPALRQALKEKSQNG